jgi:hypothetical protein
MSWAFVTTTNPVARKEYTCIWCGQKILKGEKHRKVDGVFDGDFQSDRFHPECATACDEDCAGVDNEIFEPHGYERGSRDQKGSRKVVLV